ncbi:hypothetical protein ZIOFF_058069 [Zingiber officinale]|uniref:CCHC-type domain-containing protein n=1 Tax=Zingiber officinale TaxID=94328 RepID=A0A8J5F5X8_ZINOF|nr:hypothetical protein ZIOFF_058069 [Zingiber officinale]
MNQIKCCGDEVPDKKVVEKVLRSLPQKFEHVVAVIEETKNLRELSVYELMGSLEAHERRISKYSTPVEQAFQTKLNISEKKQEQKDRAENNRESYGRGGRSRGRGRGRAGSQFRRDDQFWNRSGNIKGNCYVCKKAGHESKDCHFRCRRCKIPNHSERDCYYKNKQQQQQSSQSTVNFSKENESKQVFYSYFNTVEDMNEVWFLDSGYRNHVTGNKEHFVEIDNSYNSLLELGDSKKLKIEGKGVVAIKAANGEEKQINDVVYSPGITQNLLSIGQMMKKGYKITFADGQCEIIDKNEKRIAVVKMTTNNLFPLKMNSCINVALKSEITDEAQLWHLRYGHLNHKGLMLLKENNMVIGLPRIQPTETAFCEGCVYGKQHRFPFPKTSWRAKAPLELKEKFDEKSEKLVFIGYNNESKGYRLIDPKTNKLVISRDVIFNENAAWKWENETSQSHPTFSYPEAPVAVPSLNPTNSTAAGSSGTNSENEISEDETPPQRIDSYLQKNEFAKSSVEPSLYVKKCDADFLVACLYMDDLIYTSTSKALLEEFKKAMMDEFEMTDLGLMKYFLGFQVRQSKGEIFISQEKYVDDILKKLHMEKVKAVATPMALNEKLQQYDGAEKFDSKIYRSLIGSLIYLTHTRMDIVQSVSLLSRNPKAFSLPNQRPHSRSSLPILSALAISVWISLQPRCRSTNRSSVHPPLLEAIAPLSASCDLAGQSLSCDTKFPLSSCYSIFLLLSNDVALLQHCLNDIRK